MKDYAREENGGHIVMASCTDERFPPENMLDGKDSTFWVTTGMFPQEFVLKLDSTIRVSKITTLSLNGEQHSAPGAQPCGSSQHADMPRGPCLQSGS